MINNITYFDDADDLEKLTGLSHEELWEHGFNLDDITAGFMTEGLPIKTRKCDWDPSVTEYYIEEYANEVPAFISLLLTDWADYCCGYHIAVYNNKQYFTLHHA